MFGVCHQYLSSSVIEIALEDNLYKSQGYFCSYESKEICVARNDVLEIYRLITSTNSSKRESSKSKLRHHNVTTHNKGYPKITLVNHNEAARLELVYSQRLHGNIESLAKASNPGNLDSIILAFGDYKVSVIHFEMSTYSFGTKSMHWFEDDEIKDGLVSRHSRPIVKVDSLSRCAAVLCYNRCLAILPLTRLDEMNNSSPTISNLRSFIVYPSYEVNGALHKINNIRDIEFLEAYFHPTLAILYEEEETWAGRLAVKEDTYSVIAIAVQSEDAKSLAFRVNNLPFDCLRLQAVPQPRGGVLVYTANALLYLNQNITPYGISLNSLAERSTRFPLEPLPSVVATLEESVSLFLNADVFLISLKSGDILLAVMTSDSGKSVPRFEMRRTISSVIPSCICSVGHNHIFLGSRVGDSLLISYESVVHELVALGAQNNKTDSEEKGQFCEAEEQEDELLVFETDDQDLFHRISYNFKVCDSIINIGPVVGLDVGEPEFLSEEFADPEKLALELVTCSGYGKNGCLCVLQEGVRPIVLMSHNYSAGTSLWAERLWAIYDPQKSSAQHDFLFLSKPDSTMLISTAESDFSEAEKTFFVTQESTIHVCNMLNGAVVVQVFKTGLLIYDGETCNTVRVGGGGIARSCNSETFLALALDNAHLLLFEINENTKMLNPLPSEEHSRRIGRKEGLLSSKRGSPNNLALVLYVSLTVIVLKENDSDDEFLYGTADEELPDSKEFEGKNQQGDEPTPVKTYLFLVRLNGDLEIRLLPEGSLCFLVRGMAHGPRVLVGTGASDHEEASCFRRWKIDPNPPVITELLVVSFECLHGDIVLLAITHSGDLFVYRSYSFTETATEFDCLPLRFRRIEHEVTLRKMDNYEDEFASLFVHQLVHYNRDFLFVLSGL
ncbi:hypothetical protein Zmor_008794 [Zophobas morio]|uniref:Cleavage and polyadenylation specificity factor subunit 1 n=1 Tax=Zophobas morio TaxID=2755281 RepID=A0AA38HJ99_9CUCU|nr:hypothetical protein Zmor_008794 [Zophobas morio]